MIDFTALRNEKISTTKHALQHLEEQQKSTTKKLKSEYDKFSQQIISAIELFQKSNSEICKIIEEFTKESENCRIKRKESFDAFSQETETEIEELKNKLLSYASVIILILV